MSTNANASSGASNRTGKKEIGVERVPDDVIIRDIQKYTGNPDTRVIADCIVYDVGGRNRTDADAPAGSSVNAVATGQQTTEELEKGNFVTIATRGMLNKTTKKKLTDTRKEKEEKTEEEK